VAWLVPELCAGADAEAVPATVWVVVTPEPPDVVCTTVVVPAAADVPAAVVVVVVVWAGPPQWRPAASSCPVGVRRPRTMRPGCSRSYPDAPPWLPLPQVWPPGVCAT
jgi:hypothetical protein